MEVCVSHSPVLTARSSSSGPFPQILASLLGLPVTAAFPSGLW